MSRNTRSALGKDALDALLPPDPKESPAEPPADTQPKKPGKPPAPAPPRSAPPPTPTKRTRKKVGRPRGPNFGVKKGTRWTRADGAEMRARSVHIPVAVDKKLRRLAAEEDKPVGQVLVEILEQFLGT